VATLPEYLNSILVSDSQGNKSIRVTVAEENTAPTNILLSNSEVDEAAPAGFRIGRLSVVDSNLDDTHTLELIVNPGGQFGIENPETSEFQDSFLTLAATLGGSIDSYVIEIKATDPTGLFVIVPFTITVVRAFSNTTSLDFDGLTEYATGGDIHNYDITDAFTICGWLKPANIASAMIFFSKATLDASVNGYMVRFNATTGQAFFQLRSTGQNQSHTFTDIAITPGEWQFIAWTYAGGANKNGVNMYRNDYKSVVTPTGGGLTGTWLDGQPFYLGQRNNSFGFYNGLMDEVSVWNKELSEVEVMEIYNSGVPNDLSMHSANANLASWYRFDGDTIPNITDYAGNDDLTTVNMDASNLILDVP
jgi:hypothetical protein